MLFIGIFFVILLIIGISLYNGLIAKRNQVNYAFSAIEVILKKRFDLLPDLVETVKQYTKYEEGVLTSITELSAKAGLQQLNNQEKLDLDKKIGTAVNGMLLTVGNYPDLKANQKFLDLQSAWTATEEQVTAARRSYNYVVTNYNNGIMLFPGTVFAGMLNYQPIAVI